MKEKVAIVGPIDSEGKRVIHDKLSDKFSVIEISSEDQYSELIDVEYVVLRTFQIKEDVIEKCKNLKLVQRWGVGFDSVDIKAAGEKDIQVAVATGTNAVPVAEYAVMLMLSVYRNIISIHDNVINGKKRDESIFSKSYVINGKTVGLIGLGNIGKKVAKIVQAFGADVAYFDMFPLKEKDEQQLGIKYLSLDELVQKADIISLHLPLTEQTVNLIDAKVLEKMKSTAIIINTARGGIINEDDLYEALKSNKILGAGIDVFKDEPLKENNPLLKLNNVVLSSHCAGNTADNSINMANRCVENILTVSKGLKLSPPDLVNGQYLLNN